MRVLPETKFKNKWTLFFEFFDLSDLYIFEHLSMMMMMIFLYCNKRLVFEFICTLASTFNPHGSLSSTEDFYTKTEELQKVKVKTTHWSSTIKNSEFCIPTKNAKSLTSGQESLTPH